ncbi:MAG: amino acid adenylation domain-containing protein, partial [Tumebacillaceae bacterium]
MSMSKEDLELMALLLEEEGFELEQEEQIPPRDPSVTPMLSYSQQRLWFVFQLEPENPAYNISSDVRITGKADVEILERCFNEIIRRHEVLRTTFHNDNGVPVQQFHDDVKLTIPVIDLSDLPEAERKAEVDRLLTKEVTTPFDLTVAPLMRLTLLKLGENESVLSLSIHHIVSDGWSSGVFINEMAALYEAYTAGKPSPLPELAIQFADFAHWHRNWFVGDVAEEMTAYWKQQLSGELPVLNLPSDRPRPLGTSFGGAMYKFSISEEIKQKLAKLGHSEEATMFMILLTAYNIQLARYTGQEDLIVGSPIANRSRVELEPLIGFLANTLVFRTDLSGNPSFRELLGRVSKMALDAYAHQEMPFVKLVEEVSPDRTLGGSPLVQSFFVLQNAPMPEVHLTDLTLNLSAIESRTAKFDVSLYLVEEEQGLSAAFEYNTDLFDESTMARWAEHTVAMLEAVTQNPDIRLSELSLLGQDERQKVLVEWNDNAQEYRKDATIAQLFEEQAARTPDADAVVFGEERVTYAELNARAEQVAVYLRNRGVGPEVLVGIHVERSVEMVVGLLGILKAGGAYVPLDPAYPADRLGFILEDAQAKILLTQERLLGSLPEYQGEQICLDRDWAAIESEGAASAGSSEHVKQASAENLAYLIYTSGSTGRPKGVAIEHRNAVAMIEWAKGVYAPEQLAGVLAATSICFDLSVYELFLTLSSGGKVIVAENALSLPTLPARDEVTLINTVPSAITELLRMEAIPVSARTINLAGEPLRRALVDQIYAIETVEKVYNLYGPSEDTTYSTYTLVSRDSEQPVTIGRPITNTQAYLLDHYGQPTPIGVPGELHLGGDGLARGYLNRDELTQEKFIANPFSNDPTARLYKTGDLVRYLPNGELEYMGRIDHQVKVRGFRIELGEIETVLNQHPHIRESVLLAREDANGLKNLVAYLVAEEGVEAPSVSDLRAFLGEKLPDYMVPSVFITLEQMPLTPNGKVDRRALPAPEELDVMRAVEYVAPRNEMEQTLAEICGDLLGLEKVGVYDNFFELGGHSLLATQLISRVRQAFGVEMPLRSLFKDPTVGTLAEVIAEQQAQQQGDVAAGKPALQKLPRVAQGATGVQHFPASFSQQRLWFLDQFMPGSKTFNVASVVNLNGQLDVAALEQSFIELTRRHEALRTTFDSVDGELVQVVHATASAGMNLIDMSEVPESERDAQVHAVINEEAARPFNLVHGPLMRTTLVKKSAEEHVVIIILHHIITDGWSMGIFFSELTMLYTSFAKGAPSPLPEI